MPAPCPSYACVWSLVRFGLCLRLKVVVGRVSKALQRSPVSSEDRCFSLIAAKPSSSSLSGSSPVQSSPALSSSTGTPSTHSSNASGGHGSGATVRRTSFLFSTTSSPAKDQDSNSKDKDRLDLELTSEGGLSVEQLVAGLRLLVASGGSVGEGGVVDVVMRRTSLGHTAKGEGALAAAVAALDQGAGP
jgi:hypothetical protein